MYSIPQIYWGVKNPSAAWRELSQVANRHIRTRLPHDVGVQGSYQTGNIGDRALGEQFKTQLQQHGYHTSYFGKDVQESNTDTRILGGGGVLHDWYGSEHLKKRIRYVSGGERGYIIGVGCPGFQSEEARELVSGTFPFVLV